MFKTLISLSLVGVLLVALSSQPALALQTNTDATNVEKVRARVAKIGTGDKAKVTVRTRSGAKVKGYIAQAGADDFTVRNQKSGDATIIRYQDVVKVDRGGSSSKNLLIAIALGAAAFILIIGVVILAEKD